MRNEMSPAELRDFSDRICDMRWERRQTRAARRRAAVARLMSFVRSGRGALAPQVPAKSRS